MFQRGRHHISLLVSSAILKVIWNLNFLRFSDDFRGNRSQLIHSNRLNIRSEFRRRSLPELSMNLLHPFLEESDVPRNSNNLKFISKNQKLVFDGKVMRRQAPSQQKYKKNYFLFHKIIFSRKSLPRFT